MKKKQIFSVATIGVLSLLLVAGVAAAAVFSEDNTFTGVVNSFEKGIKIGKQGTGGVTFFNGTIINDTTTDGRNNPVTFGDNVRIDGRIQRGHNLPNDGWNVIIDDGLEINKTLKVLGEANLKGGLKFDTGAAMEIGAAAKPVADFTGAQIEGIEAGEVGAYTKSESDGKYVSKSNPQWINKTGYISLGRASFVDPKGVSVTYSDLGLLKPDVANANPDDEKFYMGDLDLPHGATVKRMTTYFHDDSGNSAINCYLLRSENSASAPDPTKLFSPGGTDVIDGYLMATASGDIASLPKWSSATTTSITNAVIDKAGFDYYVLLGFKGKDVDYLSFRKLVIEYSFTKPY